MKNEKFENKNLIFCGFTNNSLNLLNILIKNNINISAYILRYNSGSNNFKNELHKLSKKFNFKVISPKNINSKKNLNLIKKIKPYVICNWGHNQKFSKDLLKIPKIGCLNIHPGLLPNGRGSGAVQGEIINSKKLGWTVHFMDDKFDKGIVFKKFYKLFSYNNLYLDKIQKKLLVNIIPFYAECIIQIMKKKINYKNLKKIKFFGRYYPKFTDGDEVIDFNENSKHIISKVRSRSPFILSIIYINKSRKKYYVRKVEKSKVQNYKFINGQVIDNDKKGILVKTNDNAIWITEGSFDKKKFGIPNFKIGTNFFCNSSGTILTLINRLNLLEKKISKIKKKQ